MLLRPASSSARVTTSSDASTTLSGDSVAASAASWIAAVRTAFSSLGLARHLEGRAIARERLGVLVSKGEHALDELGGGRNGSGVQVGVLCVLRTPLRQVGHHRDQGSTKAAGDGGGGSAARDWLA